MRWLALLEGHTEFIFIGGQMAKKAGKIALITLAIILLTIIYLLNFTLLWFQSSEIYLLFIILASTLLYLLCWLIVLFIAYKRNAKRLFRLYCIYWSIATICFALEQIFSIPIFAWFSLIFFIPIAGIDSYIFYLSNGFIHARDMSAAKTSSLVMLVLGVAAKKRRTV